jgi:transcriptional regulator with XRE-family HTH domain
MKKQRKIKSGSPRPEDVAVGCKLRLIRESQKWSQNHLAKMLGVRQPLISAWEAGHLPSPRMYFKFSRLPLDYEDQLWLAEKAGADLKAIENIAEGLRKRRHAPPPPEENTRILPMPKIEGEGPDLVVSGIEIPHPYLTKYVHVKDNFMSPQYWADDILVIDTSEADPWTLEEGSCVAVCRSQEYAEQQQWAARQKEFEESHSREEVEERRRRMSFPYAHIGLFVGWLHRQIEPTATVTATPTEEHPSLLTPGESRPLMHGWFFLEAPWVRETLSARRPHYPPDTEVLDASGLTILGLVIGHWRRQIGKVLMPPAAAKASSKKTGKEKKK